MRSVTAAPEVGEVEPGALRPAPDPWLEGLIEAKLVPPRVHGATVRRTRLLRRLRSAQPCRVVSILAPPGYGKTNLLAQWAASGAHATAWLTADDGDNDPVTFLTYVAASINRLAPLDPGILSAIRSPVVSARTVIGRLLAAISGHQTPVLLAIDDAHRLTNQACLDALAELIAYLPEPSQVALAGRELIGLPLPRWRADGSMLEIGPDDLAMDEQETAALGHQLGLSSEATKQLARQTEGWPALLALAALGIGRGAALDAPSAAASQKLIAAYLRSELLERRSEVEIAFMTHTSILERLTGPLCDAVVGGHGSGDVLAGLAQSTILVDEYGGWYRYHPLLRDFLRAELAAREPAQVAQLHRQAATWYEATGAVDAAVDHAFASGDLDLASVLAGKAMSAYHWSGRGAATRAWFQRFGDQALVERPWLAVSAAWEELAVGDVAATERLADIAERGAFEGRPPDGSASFESQRAMLRAIMCRGGTNDMLANASRAAELERAGSPWRDFALWTLAVARLTLGDQDGADAALADAIAAARSARNIGLLSCLLGHRALVAIDRGDWNAAGAFAEEGSGLAAAVHLDGRLSMAPYRAARARLAIHRGDIQAAHDEHARAVRLRPLLTAAAPPIAVLSLLGLARAHLAMGDGPGARTLLAQASDVIRVRPDLGVLPAEVAALRATIASLPVGLAGGASTITAAELRVLALLPYYLSFKEIGQRLGTKASTVKTHALAIYGKLGASSRSEAVDLAVQAGLLDHFPG